MVPCPWTGSNRFQSPLSVNPNQWYHCVAVFDPISSRTTLHLNGGSITSDSLGLDGNSKLVRIGQGYWNRTFDGLIDDVRVWGRPISVTEVQILWGNGMGDLDPKAKLEFDSIAWSNQMAGKLILNQAISDFNASASLDLSGLSPLSISEESSTNGTVFNLVLVPDSISPGTLTIGLPEGAITDVNGVTNPPVQKEIDFRPHRVRESDLLLWWELNPTSSSSGSFDPSSISGVEVWFDANDSGTISYGSGSTISTWLDKSGNGGNATTTLKPELQLSWRTQWNACRGVQACRRQ